MSYNIAIDILPSNYSQHGASYVILTPLCVFCVCYVAVCCRLLSSITGPIQPQSSEPPSYDSVPSSSPGHEEAIQCKRVCFKVNEDDQEDSGHDTMSHRDSYR